MLCSFWRFCPLGVVYLCFRAGEIGNGLFVLAVEAGAVYLFIKYKRKGKKEEAPKNPNTAVLRTEAGGVQLGNPFRGVFVLGAAGSGKVKVLQCLCFPSLSAWGLRVWYMISNFRHWQKMYNPL